MSFTSIFITTKSFEFSHIKFIRYIEQLVQFFLSLSFIVWLVGGRSTTNINTPGKRWYNGWFFYHIEVSQVALNKQWSFHFHFQVQGKNRERSCACVINSHSRSRVAMKGFAHALCFSTHKYTKYPCVCVYVCVDMHLLHFKVMVLILGWKWN